MQELYQLFLCVVMKFVRNLRDGYVKEQTFVISIVGSMIENMGYMALKADFKACMIQMITKQREDNNTLIEAFKYLIMLSVQCKESIHLQSALIFFMLNMVRSDDYDVMLPSVTLKIHSELNEKDMSYFELKQL